MLKIVLFRKGRPGMVARLPGEKPEEEFETMLGGAANMWPISGRLMLVELAHADKLGLPRNYTLLRTWTEAEPVYGDCAVVAIDEEGRYIDVTTEDCDRAAEAVLPVTRAAS